MKRRLSALLLCCALLAACGAAPTVPAETPPAPDDFDAAYNEDEARAAAMDFAVRLLQNTADGGGNALVSPFSVWSALGMTAAGAEGETLAEMTAALGLAPNTLGPCLRDYAAGLPKDGCLHAANGLWLRDDGGLTVEDSFLRFAKKYYDADVRKAAFDGGTVRDINAFVKKHTAGHIERIVEGLDPSTMLVLVNALSFDAEWETVYREDQVREGVFTAAGGEEQPVSMMRSTEGVFLQDGDAATGFLKPYAGGRYAFAALLPAEGTTPEAYLAGLTGARLAAVLADAQAGIVYAGLPKFESSGGCRLNDALSAMGMPGAFTPDADFSAMGHYDGGGLFIGEVLHKAAITVDERGTKAGAATAVTMDAAGAMVEYETHTVICDRPFLFLLLDTEWQLPLFIGTVDTVA